MSNQALNLLGNMPAKRFLRDYWQKRPLLIRRAWKDFKSPIDGDDLAGLSLENEVESRLVIGPNHVVEYGPFLANRFNHLPNNRWTLLVQAVNLWVPEVHAMLDKFHFLPRWRIDDVMVSYACKGGGVGPHFDDYDVFLLQGKGRRHWQIGAGECEPNVALRGHSDLKILADFRPEQEWILDEGDMLYLPPRWAHNGVALDHCITFSVGYRAPSLGEMLDDLATEIIARGEPKYLRDPPLTPPEDGDEIQLNYVLELKTLLLSVLNDDRLLSNWFAQYMTQPKYPHLTELTKEKRKAKIKIPLAFDGKSTEYVTRTYCNAEILHDRKASN